MGRTKALVDVGGRPMAARVLDALADGGCETRLLVGGDADELAALGVPVLTDQHPGEGPVGGLITALAATDDDCDVVVVVACDLPYLDGPSVRRLIAATTDVAAVAWTDRVEPMCAVWPVTQLAEIEDAFADGVRSMHGLLELVDHDLVDVDPGRLRNVNRPEDLGRADPRR